MRFATAASLAAHVGLLAIAVLRLQGSPGTPAGIERPVELRWLAAAAPARDAAPDPVGGSSAPETAISPATDARLQPAGAAAAAVSALPGPERSDAGPAEASEPARRAALPSAPASSAVSASAPASAADVPGASVASAPPDAPGLPPTLDPRAVVDGYVLRRALDTPPRPRSEVPLAWPPGWFSSGPMVGAFTVFIDERGVVQRIVADGPTLPPRLQQAAEEAFKATAFEPGRVGAQAVKSLIRVEVAFTQDTPVQGAPTVVRQRPL